MRSRLSRGERRLRRRACSSIRATYGFTPARFCCGSPRHAARRARLDDMLPRIDRNPEPPQILPERLTIPLTIGGGIRSVDEASAALRSGADKISVNSAAVARPELLGELAHLFGAQAVVASVDARRRPDGGYEVCTHGGRRGTGLNALEWAERCAALGAGEILLTSIDRDGTREGYDLDLLRRLVPRVRVPVIASGGAGCMAHVGDAVDDAGADAALLAGILHNGSVSIGEIKQHLAARGLPVRPSARAVTA